MLVSFIKYFNLDIEKMKLFHGELYVAVDVVEDYFEIKEFVHDIISKNESIIKVSLPVIL